MSEFSNEALIGVLALVGIVIIIAALLSGIIERTGFPQVAVFLLIGAMLGPAGLGLLNLTLDSPILHTVTTLSLALVLFTDAISLDINEIRRSGPLTLLVLGPGTLLSTALIALLAWGLLHLPLVAAILLGAALASTDPVLLRGLLRRDDIPPTARQALRLESGLNDAVLLPIVLVAMELLSKSNGLTPTDWGRLALDLCVLGPGAGMLVGVCGVATMALIRKRFGIRRDYESLFSLGIAFTAYAAAEAVHGSGFLAAFVAGLTISALDIELCDCFLEYGETTAELTLLFTFVLFGTSLIWGGLTILTIPLIIFAVCALLVRPIAFYLSLARVRLGWKERQLIAWFGPRGLSSLLLILLPVFSGIPGSQYLFLICSLVVLLSVISHGGLPLLLQRRNVRQQNQLGTTPDGSSPLPLVPAPAENLPAENLPVEDVPAEKPPTEKDPASAAVTRGLPLPVINQEATEEKKAPESAPVAVDQQQRAPSRIILKDLRELIQRGEQVILLDARKPRDYSNSDVQASGSIRLSPDNVAFQARQMGLPTSAYIVVYCT
ncbi:hypothetical protein KDA_71520 [Dictyobacter alpinus]|uniref:Cation/H+ exchanger transmembrane domain-containing protein n=1 Tax=Dictyobacter alpinus TaxID=2014873 RepID=A0A402BJY9_9CHLR|nr:cation:proton antiporter [Dictyobacter alpinus]GCE31668.1 hypothetical protein KDA_71520 [Dictyobacter alpinus]